VISAGQLDVAGDYVVGKDFNYDGNQLNDKAAIPLRLLYGVIPGLEIGGAYDFHRAEASPNPLNRGDDANAWNLNAKYKLPFRPLGATWGVGGIYSCTDLNATADTVKDTQIYFAGTRTLLGSKSSGMRLDGTVGVNWTHQSSVDSSPVRFFGGAQLYLTNSLSVAGDIQCKQESMDSDPLYSLVGRLRVNSALSLQAGWTNADFTLLNGDRDSRFFAGVKLGLGKS
jgi:hypothetical protein